MTDNVIVFPGFTRLDIPPDRVLDEAKKAGLEKVVVVGWTKDGEEYFGYPDLNRELQCILYQPVLCFWIGFACRNVPRLGHPNPLQNKS